MVKFNPHDYKFTKTIGGITKNFVPVNVTTVNSYLVVELEMTNPQTKETTLLEAEVINSSRGWAYLITNLAQIEAVLEVRLPTQSLVISTKQAEALYEDYPHVKSLTSFVEYQTQIDNLLDLVEVIMKVKPDPPSYLEALAEAENLFSSWGASRMQAYEEITDQQFTITYEAGRILPPWKSYHQGELEIKDQLLQAINNHIRK